MMNEESLEFIEYINNMTESCIPQDDYVMQQFERSERQNEEVFAKLITGERVYTKRKNLIGFCHCKNHKGCITKTLYKSHDCGGKNCFYFERTNDEYWSLLDKEKAKKRRRKEAAKFIKQKEERKSLHLKNTAQNLSNKLGYSIQITSVKKPQDKTYYIIYYISEREFDDRIRFLDLAEAFGYTMNAGAQLCHVRNINGDYAVISGHSKREMLL